MTHCCTTSNIPPPRAACPANGKIYPQVSLRTVLHHVAKPWRRELTSHAYYFCDDPDCDVVYFGEDKRLLRRNSLRQPVGQKSRAADRHICYCFDIRMTDLLTEDNKLKLRSFVLAQTKTSTCDCEIRNPSGRCCLKDFPREANH